MILRVLADVGGVHPNLGIALFVGSLLIIAGAIYRMSKVSAGE